MTDQEMDGLLRSATFEATSRPGLSIAECPTAGGLTYLVAFNGQLLGNVRLGETLHGWWAYSIAVPGATGPHDTKIQAAESLMVHVVDTPERCGEIGRGERQARSNKT